MSLYTPDVAAALAGPNWLRARRSSAAERFLATAMPSPDEEVWRYSRIAELDLDAFRPATSLDQPDSGAEEAAGGERAAIAGSAATVHVTDGRVTLADVGASLRDMGVWIGRLAGAPDGEGALGSVASEPADALALLNDAFCAEPILVRVPRGVTVDGPIVVVHHGASAGTATFPRLVVQAAENSEATVVEQFTSGGGEMLTVPVTELDVAPAARLRYVSVQELGWQTWQVASQVSRVAQDATFLAASAALGGDYARLRTDCRLEGAGATGDLLSAYFGEGDQTLDFRTFQDHRAPDTTSTLLFKGAVGGRSHSVYTGLIRVRKEARGTNAFQTNRNIKLSDEAWAESVPNLEIETNDVRCSHASAVGPIDEEQRFYLESRGVPPQVAERLVVAGFFDEVLRRIPVPGLLDPLRARIVAKLDRQGASDG